MTDDLASGSRDSSPIIITKVRPPRRRRDLLHRARLVDLVSRNIDRKLILLSAPAGYGKTSLLVDYIHEVDIPVCWYRLDHADTDPASFLEYLVASLRQRYPAVGARTLALLRGSNRFDVETLVGSLVNEIAEHVPELFLLVLDDFQMADEAVVVSGFVDSLIHYLPDSCRLIIASRTVPRRLTLTRLIGQGQAFGIGPEHLRFTPDEICGLVRLLHGEELTVEESERLAEASEGWVAALVLGSDRMLASVRQGLSRPALAGDQLFDYLAEQVLAEQPARTRTFLVRTSILDTLTPSLCDHLLGRDDSAEQLRWLEEQGLFLTRMDGDGAWFRYHNLFRTFLRHRLAEQPDALHAELHRRAAAWYAEHDQPELQIAHLLDATEYERAAAVIAEAAETVVDRGRFSTVVRWCKALPEAVLNDAPWVLCQFGRALENLGELSQALAVYDRAEHAFEQRQNDAGRREVWMRRMTTLRLLGLVESSIEYSRRVIDEAEDDEALLEARAHRNLGACFSMQGDMDRAAEAIQTALSRFEVLGADALVAYSHTDLSAIYQRMGQVARAVYHSEQSRRYFQETGNLGSLALATNNTATAYHQQGRFEEAERQLHEAITNAERAGARRTEAYAWASLGDVVADRHRLDDAVSHYGRALELARAVGDSNITGYVLAASAEALRLRGDISVACTRLVEAREELSGQEGLFEHGLLAYVSGTLALERDRPDEAARHIEAAAEHFGRIGSRREVIRALLYRYVLALRYESRDAAEHWLEQLQAGLDEFEFSASIAPHVQRLGSELPAAIVERFPLNGSQPASQPVAARPPVEETPRPPTLVVNAFGVPEVTVAGRTLASGDWQTTKARDLFFYLAGREEGATRDELAVAFWPESSPAKARTSVHSTLYRLRRALDVDVDIVVHDGGRYQVRWPEDAHYDVAAFDAHCRRARTVDDEAGRVGALEAAVALVRGPYLDGVTTVWAHERREQLALEVVEARLTLGRAYLKTDQPEKAAASYRQVLDRDPLREDAHRGRMRALALAGDRVGALRQYERCRQVLEAELQIDPAPATTALYEAIRREEPPPVP